SRDGGGRFEILATTGSFHGRTFATLTATGQEKYHTGFLPLLPGIRLVPYDDLAAMEAAVRDETVAIMVEPVQGEGGVVVPAPGYLAGLRALAARRNVLLILDEIQCGLGRTGRLFAHEHAGITPDIVTLAKALGGGLPIGATCTTERVAAAFTPGAHGSTFGGNPVACAAAIAALRALAEPELLEHVRRVGQHFRSRLEALVGRHGVREVRGMGLMLGTVLDRPGAPVVDRCREAGLLINCTAERVPRFLPPLIISRPATSASASASRRATSPGTSNGGSTSSWRARSSTRAWSTSRPARACRSSTASPTCTIPARSSPTASRSSSAVAGWPACASPSSATATTRSTRGWTPPRAWASTSFSPARPATRPTRGSSPNPARRRPSRTTWRARRGAPTWSTPTCGRAWARRPRRRPAATPSAPTR